jgi:asparagine synthase (glutamine-hydrolysing)
VCGIAGYVGHASPELLPAMLATLRHRGPDDSGIHEEPGIGLGMTRLAIIDLAAGRQPMANEDGSIWIVFNGEIYNHRLLRRDLEAKGHRFATESDTEAILHLYEDMGEECVEALRGMFAFAIWDRPRQRLLLARDRLGKKPLYYWHCNGLFLFGSEIKALLAHPDVGRDLDQEALHHYLAFGYTPAVRSIFAEVAKLPPAHTATLQGGSFTLRRYWDLPPGRPAGETPTTPGEATERIRHALREAVRLRLESDVPLGVFLSGGIDSSAVVACMREVSNQRIATFSIGFGRAAPSFDELPYARMVAERFGTDHTEEILEPRVADLLPAIVHHFDEPFADSSAIPTFVVAQATARHVKVALSGIGGDETFAGYPRYLGVRLSNGYGRLPHWLRNSVTAVLNRTLPDSDGSANWGNRARRFVRSAELPMPERYIAWTRFFSDAALAALATPALRARWNLPIEDPHHTAYAARGHDDPVDGAFRIDLATYLPNDLLVMADRMSMAHSLELRAPFCDHFLIEESLRLSPSLKMPGLRLKGLLKAAFSDILPAAVLSHRKQGFMIPLARWLRSDLREVMEDLLSPGRLRERGLFDPGAVAAMKSEHLDGRRSHGDHLWTLMMLELWMRQYLTSEAPCPIQAA